MNSLIAIQGWLYNGMASGLGDVAGGDVRAVFGAMAAAVLFGAVHALMPGHGKTVCHQHRSLTGWCATRCIRAEVLHAWNAVAALRSWLGLLVFAAGPWRSLRAHLHRKICPAQRIAPLGLADVKMSALTAVAKVQLKQDLTDITDPEAY